MHSRVPRPVRALWAPGPARLAAPVEEVHVWRAELGRPAETAEAELDLRAEAEAALSAAERRRAEEMRRPEWRRRWVASRLALRDVLSRYLDEDPAIIRLRAGQHGKPELAGAGGIGFNLSHSAGIALVAVSGSREVGVDVEHVQADRDFLAIAARALGPDAAGVRGAKAGRRLLRALGAARGPAQVRGGAGSPGPHRPAPWRFAIYRSMAATRRRWRWR